MEGGQRVTGEIGLRPLTIDGDIGRYSIPLDKIKMIRFLKPAKPAAVGNPDEPGAARDAAAPRRGLYGGNRNALGAANDPLNEGMGAWLTHGKVSTTLGKDIIGDIYVPMNFKVALDIGTLYPADGTLRTITFNDGRAPEGRPAEPARPAAARPAGPPAQGAGPEAAEAERAPSSFRQGNRLFVFMPGGNRVAIYDLETKKSQAIELASAKDGPVQVSPVVGPDILALNVSGSRLTRIAVADLGTGTWHAQDLRQPIEGNATPIVGPGVALYILGRYAYAYSARAHRWDVAELPDGVRASRLVLERRDHAPGPRTYLPLLGRDREVGTYRPAGHPGRREGAKEVGRAGPLSAPGRQEVVAAQRRHRRGRPILSRPETLTSGVSASAPIASGGAPTPIRGRRRHRGASVGSPRRGRAGTGCSGPAHSSRPAEAARS